MLKAQFLSLWDGLLSATAVQNVVVVAATNRPADVDPAVLRRLPLSYEVELPAAAGREDVLRLLLRDEPLARDVDLRALAAATDGYSGSDLDQLCKTAAMRVLEDALAAEAAAEAATTAAAEAATTANAEGPTMAAAEDVSEHATSTLSEVAAPPICPMAALPAEPQLPVVTLSTGSPPPAGAIDSDTHRPAPSLPTSSAPVSRRSRRLIADTTCTVADANPLTPPSTIQLRRLTLDDFLQARAIVRPTRGRFAGTYHDVATPPPPPADFDEDLYN